MLRVDRSLPGASTWEFAMVNIPLHIKRRLEQRWATRFATSAPKALKDVGTKATQSNPTDRRAGHQTPMKPPPIAKPAGS